MVVYSKCNTTLYSKEDKHWNPKNLYHIGISFLFLENSIDYVHSNLTNNKLSKTQNTNVLQDFL